MNSQWNIRVSAMTRSAEAAFQRVQGRLQAMRQSMRDAAGETVVGQQQFKELVRFGNQLQWTGRMIQYNFTLPIVAAGAAATKWALDIEKSMTKITKVYGDLDAASQQIARDNGRVTASMADTQQAAQVFRNELDALGDAFVAISNHYGVAQTDVLEVASAWAAAGQSGVDLARSVDLTMKAIIIGDMEAAKATEALIAVQAQFNLSTTELNETLAKMNAIENATGISMQGLIEGFSRAAGVARSAGVDVDHLGAMLAALTPAAGSAANAGNALKTIYSRLMAPTRESAQVMNEMGLNLDSVAWQSSTVTERLMIMADAFEGLSTSQKNVASSVIASRWQINKFDILMRELASDTGYYQKALDATNQSGNKAADVFARMQHELNAVLESDPRKLQRMWVIIQNASADAIQPLIPYIIYLAGVVGKLAQAFADMSPVMQHWVLAFLVILAALGPVIRYLGALMTLIRLTGGAFAFLVMRVIFADTWLKIIKGSFIAVGIAAQAAGLLLASPFIVLYKSVQLSLAALALIPPALAAVAGVIAGPLAGIATLFAGPFRAAGALAAAAFGAGLKAIGPLTIGVMKIVGGLILGASTAITGAMYVLGSLAATSFTFGFKTIAGSMGAMATALAPFYAKFLAGFWFNFAALLANVGKLVVMGTSRLIFLPLFTVLAAFSTPFAAYVYRVWDVAFVQTLMMVKTRLTIFLAGIGAAMVYGTAMIGALLRGAWRVVWMNLVLLQLAWGRTMTAASAVFGFGLAKAHALIGAGLATVWSTTYALLIRLQIAWSAGMVRLHVMFSAGFLAVQRGLAFAFLASWAAIAKGWAVITSITFKKMIGFFVAFGTNIVKVIRVIGVAMLNPWVAAAAAIGLLIYALRDQIVEIWDNIVRYLDDVGFSIAGIWEDVVNVAHRAFNSLPQGIQDALTQVVRVVSEAAKAIYEWFSYINPWARHSPSLVENVTTGMNEVTKQFGRLRGIKGDIMSAYAEIKRFGQMTSGLSVNAINIEQNQDRKALKDAGAGAALGSYNKLVGIMARLQGHLNIVNALMEEQERIVERWADKLEAADKELDKQQKTLAKLQDTLDGYQNKLNDAEDALSRYANAPIKGMQAMEDQIHANEVAQNKMRWEIMKLEETFGTFDQLKSKIEAINGAQELLRGTQAGLRSAGAGSDILSEYDKQLAALDQQKDKYKDAADQIAAMQARLEKLQLEAEKLDLVKAMKFDELQYQIDKAANSIQEMSFQEIMDGITKSKQQMDYYGQKVEDATQKVREQQSVVDRAQATRDRIQERLDQEQDKLDTIKGQYDDINGAIQAIEESLGNVMQAADTFNQKMEEAKKKRKAAADAAKKGRGRAESVSPGLQNFRDAAGGNFADVGGGGIPLRTDWSDQSAQIDKFTEDMAKQTADMFESMNPFKPLMDKAKAAWDWIKSTAKSAWDGIGNFASAAFGGVNFGEGTKVNDIFDNITGAAKEAGDFIKDFGGSIWRLLGPDLKKIGKEVWNSLGKVWKEISPEIEKFKELWPGISKIIKVAWTAIKIGVSAIVGILLFLIKIVTSVLAETIGPAIDMIVAVVKNVIRIVRGVLKVIVGLFTGDLGMMKDGVLDIFWGLVNGIWAILKGSWNVIKGVVEGIVKGVVGFFTWLWDELVGHSIVPDIVNGIVFWFKKLLSLPKWIWNNVLKPVYDWFKKLWTDHVKPALKGWWEGIKNAWGKLKDIPGWLWNNTWGKVISGVRNLWSNHVRPALKGWWEGIKSALSKVKDLYVWLWNNSWGRVISGVKNLWSNHIKPELGKWWERMKNAWSNLKNLGGWFRDFVMNPIRDKIKSGWTSIRDWINGRKDWIVSPFKAVVRGVVGAINWIVKGINKLDSLPGVAISISPVSLPRGFATGTNALPLRRANRGMMTTGARAITGEGKANHPEFVIPTDPTYRQRALGLLSQAAGKLGVKTGANQFGVMGDSVRGARNAMKANARNAQGIPMYDIGGILGEVGSAFVNLKGKAVSTGKNILKTTMSPFIKLAKSQTKRIQWDVGQQVANGAIDLATRWLDKASTEYGTEWTKNSGGGPKVQKALSWAKSQEGKPYVWGGVGPGGYDCSGFMSAITNVMRGRSPHSRVGATASFPWPGFSGRGPFPPNGFIIGSSPNYSGGIGHMAGTLGGVNVESRGGQGVVIGSSARGYMDSGFTQRAQLVGLKAGGIIRRSRGGTIVRVGEGANDEVVEPLPRNWKRNGRGGDGKTYYFYGDLSFPNIKSGDDAKLFLDNLENLGKD